MKYESLLDFIRQSPIPASTRAPCPTCQSTAWHTLETWTTLVGGPEGVNHETRSCVCVCGARFKVHSKDKFQWITNDNGRVFAGVPTCFEDYILTCFYCDGDVQRHYTDLTGVMPVVTLGTTISKGKSIKHYRVFWKCLKCNKEIETADDHWSPL